jgi:hypothetical protein
MKNVFKRINWLDALIVAGILILIGRCAAGCGDKDLHPGIEGAWRQTAPASPGWLYDFRDGIVTQTVKDFGATLSQLTFTYAERGDTLYIGGDGVNAPRVWVKTMLGDADMKVREMPADTGRVWDVLYFERMLYP